MRRKSPIAIPAFLVLMFAAAATAQMPGMMGPPSVRGVWAPVVGSGSVYQLETKKDGKREMEFAIVGAETVNGKPGHWMEIAFQDRSGPMVMKNLIILDGKDTRVARMIVQPPGQEAMEFPMEMMQMMNRGASREVQKADIREGATKIGTETITVPAGTYTCEHYRTSDGADVWVSEKASPYGLVKMTSADANMTLMKALTNATTKIRGVPRKMDMSGMGQRP